MSRYLKWILRSNVCSALNIVQRTGIGTPSLRIRFLVSYLILTYLRTYAACSSLCRLWKKSINRKITFQSSASSLQKTTMREMLFVYLDFATVHFIDCVSRFYIGIVKVAFLPGFAILLLGKRRSRRILKIHEIRQYCTTYLSCYLAQNSCFYVDLVTGD